MISTLILIAIGIATIVCASMVVYHWRLERDIKRAADKRIEQVIREVKVDFCDAMASSMVDNMITFEEDDDDGN